MAIDIANPDSVVIELNQEPDGYHLAAKTVDEQDLGEIGFINGNGMFTRLQLTQEAKDAGFVEDTDGLWKVANNP